MFQKSGRMALIALLCLGIMIFPVSKAFTKQPVQSPPERSKKINGISRVPKGLVLRSAAALVEDQKTGELLIHKKASAIVPIASITKLMTAMVVLDAESDLDALITIQPDDIDTLRHSHSRVPVGAEFRRRDVLLIALMASDNRSAHALGRTYPGGFAACVAAMNEKALSLGLLETRFVDSTGLSSQNVSSARDLVRLVDAAHQYQLIREYTTCRQAAIRSGRQILEFRNTNRLVLNPRWEIGLSKTGYIDEAGRCLVMQVQVAKRPLLIVLLDSQGKLTRLGDANRIKKWIEDAYPEFRTRKG